MTFNRLCLNAAFFKESGIIDLESFGREKDLEYIEYLINYVQNNYYLKNIMNSETIYNEEVKNYIAMKYNHIFIRKILELQDPYWSEIIKTAKENCVVREIIE